MATPEQSQEILQMMAREKIVLMHGLKFALNPSFIEILNSNLSKYPPAIALIMSVKSFCYTASQNEWSVIAGGTIKVLEMCGEYDVANDIKNNLDIAVPGPIKDELGKLMDKIHQEHDLK